MRRSTGEPDAAAFNPRLELFLAAALLAFGLLALPALIFGVGQTLLGGYGAAEDGGIGAFYADFFGDLGGFSLRAWLLALGPALTIYALRGILRQRATNDDADDEPVAAPRATRSTPRPAAHSPAPAARRARVEPRVSRD